MNSTCRPTTSRDSALCYFSPKQTTSLCVLRLRSCWELTNHGLLNLVHALPQPRAAVSVRLLKISDDGVELLAENLRQLRSLDLSWCPRVSDAALESIACELSQLEELTLDRNMRGFCLTSSFIRMPGNTTGERFSCHGNSITHSRPRKEPSDGRAGSFGRRPVTADL
ncbi:hypothetical protein CEXT_460011 [Caerostris extrusa]|uniref:Uncharacterized protein n=1 Tax=Caerostris extrusa TaxID=172846 RepID=A0AAV4UYP0_CAEEX|nr:hypothetical protein CEXT_460011 [Caerostris extrusa]